MGVPYRLEKETSASEDGGPWRGVDCDIPRKGVDCDIPRQGVDCDITSGGGL